MQQIYDRVAGLDVHRDTVVTCFRRLGPRGGVVFEKERFGTTTAKLRELEAWLTERQVELVAMEATGVYWKPVYYALECRFTVWLCNARNVKKVPGRKTDLTDAEWPADVAAHGMIRPSFVPPPPIRELRELTRYRKTQSAARAAEIQRLEKVLQDAGIKLTSVASRVLTQSGRAMIEALIAGERDGAKLAELALGKMRPKVPALTEALTGHFGSHHAVACRRILGHLDFLNESIQALTEQIDQRTAAFASVYTSLLPVPGVDRLTIDVIIAETGADMSRFPTPGDLASWVGVCPGSHESAGKRRRVGTTKGNPWLRQALIESARAAARTKGSYFGAQYRQIARRRGPNKAAMAIAHSLITLVWHLLNTGVVYTDLGDDYFTSREDPDRRARRLVAQLEQLGFKVTPRGSRRRVTDDHTLTSPTRPRAGAVLVCRHLPNCGRGRGGISPQIDARVLAELSVRDLVPAIWLPTVELRQERKISRWRLHLVKHRSTLKNRVHSTLITFGHQRHMSDLFGVSGRRLLKELEIPEPWRSHVDASLVLIDDLEARITQIAKDLRRSGADHRYIPILLTAPGFGWITSFTVACEIGDISRFASPVKLAGYTGLCPRVKQSGQMDQRGPLSKHGPKYLRWGLMEAAIAASSHPLYRERYQRTRRRLGRQRGPKVAQIDLACQLTEAIWYMLTRNQPFAPAGAINRLAA